MEAKLYQGGESSGFNGDQKILGEPVNDAIISVLMTSPDGQKVAGFLTRTGEGTYTITLETALTGNYDISVIASDNVPNGNENNSQYLITTEHSFFISPSEVPVESSVGFPPYPVFANQNVTLGTSVKVYDGKIGSNSNISIGGSSNVHEGVEGNGSFSSGTSVNVGPITFNSAVDLGGSRNVTGDVNSAASMHGGTSVCVNGNIISGSIVDLGGSTNVSGNVDANGNVNLGTSAKVYGNLTTSGNLYKSTSAMVYGTTTENGTPIVPQSYGLIALPPATTFNSGGTNITSSCTLSPGSYGNVNLGTSKTLNFSSGDYYFDSFSMSGSGKLNMNVTGWKDSNFCNGKCNIWYKPVNECS